MLVTLIGYRGSGKSTVAAPLAARLGWGWVDADTEIERRAGCSIRDIFREEGEGRFRELEREVLADLLNRVRLVVAAGGGAVLNAETRAEMRHAGPVVWLKAGVEILHERIHADASSFDRRPDLTDQGGLREIEGLLHQREPLYAECATLTVETDGLSVDDVVETILTSIEPSLDAGRRA